MPLLVRLRSLKGYSVRVFLGPYNIAGLLWGYRRGLTELGVDCKVIAFEESPFGYRSDVAFNFKGNQYLRTLRRIPHLPALIGKFDIFHLVYGNSLLGPYPYNFDVPVLKMLQKRIVMSFLGYDIKCSEEVINGRKAIVNCRDCEIGDIGTPHSQCRVEKKICLVKFWSRYSDAIFCGMGVSGVLDALGVEWHPLILPCDLNYWKPFESNFYPKKSKMLILHAPSDKQLKGERFVTAAIRKLKDEGYDIDFKLLTSQPNYKVREWLNVSDIVIDQMLTVWHGMFSVESMAMAKPTICSIDEKYKKQFEYARDLPIVSANPDTLYDKLKILVDNSKLRKEIAYKSRRYAEEVHDSKKVAQSLLQVYESLW